MSYNDVIPWSGFAMSPWGRSGGIAPFDQLFERRESFPKGFSFWGREMIETSYVYELVDKETGKWYIGSRTAVGCCPEDLGVKYFTSSRTVSSMFRKNPERFEKKILVVSDPNYVTSVERSLLEFRDAMHDPMSYNLSNGMSDFEPSKSSIYMHANARGSDGKSTIAVKAGKSVPVESLRLAGIKGGKVTGHKAAERLHSVKTADGKSVAAISAGTKGGAENARRGNLLKIASIGGKIGGALGFANKTGIHKQTLQEKAVFGKRVGSLKYKCLGCGLNINSGNFNRHQKSSGCSGKEEITNVYA